VKGFERRISKIEKTVNERYGDISEEERKNCFEKFKKEAPMWLKEILALFFHLIDELAEVESRRDPEKWKGVIKQNPNFSLRGNLFDFLSIKFGYLREDVQKAIKALAPEELERIDRTRVKAKFQSIINESDNLSDQTRNDLLKILSNPHKKDDNSTRHVWGLLPWEAEGGGRWEFRGGGWTYFDENPPRWNGSEWVTVKISTQ